jgi:alcohol dehydrogenase class IV
MTLAERWLELRLADRAHFGAGSVALLPGLVRETGCRRTLVTTDAGVAASGVLGRVVDTLRADGLEVEVFDGVQPNPGHASCQRAARPATDAPAQTCVVGLGGGSSIDTAKVVALAAANPEVAIGDLGYDDPLLAGGLPLIAVPTTAGTGAETNSFAVVTDDHAKRKTYIGHPSLLPRATVLDPVLTLGLPAAATAATGIDAMTHSLESLLSRNPNPFAEALALAVIRTVATWLGRAHADGTDLEARSRMLMASHLAGIGQASGTGVGAVHALGHAIGTRCQLPHGTALAAVLPEVLGTYRDVREHELAQVGVALGVASRGQSGATASEAALKAMRELLSGLGQRPGLRALGLDEAMEPVVVADALADPAIANSPRLPSAVELADILVAARA